jgi:DNA-binding beta-propeller fold protein YncE
MTLDKPWLIVLQLAAALLLAACATDTGKSGAMQKPVFPPPPDEARFVYERTLYSSADVEKGNQSDELRRLLTGETSRTGEGLDKPYGVAVYHGRVFVSDSTKRRVAVFDIPEQRYFTIGEKEPGAMGMPLGLDVDGKGNLYVVDATNKQVQVYDRDGKFLRSMGGPTWFHRPSGVAVNAAGSRVYVVDAGGVSSQEHRVRVFDGESGSHLMDIGKRGKQPGEFNFPVDATIGLDEMLYVVDSGNFRVAVFRPDGTFVRSFGAPGTRSGQFARPKEIATDPAGNVYVVDNSFANFQVFTPEGQLLLSVGNRDGTDGMAKFMLPSGIAIDGDGRIYMADQFFRKVDVFRPAKLPENAGFTVKKSVGPKQ